MQLWTNFKISIYNVNLHTLKEILKVYFIHMKGKPPYLGINTLLIQINSTMYVTILNWRQKSKIDINHSIPRRLKKYAILATQQYANLVTRDAETHYINLQCWGCTKQIYSIFPIFILASRLPNIQNCHHSIVLNLSLDLMDSYGANNIQFFSKENPEPFQTQILWSLYVTPF